MIFFFKSSGDIMYVEPEKVFQGSNKASEIKFYMPCEKNSIVDVAFTLPNGESTLPHTMENTGEKIFVDGDKTFKFSTYNYELPKCITAYDGSVTVQFYVTLGNGEVLTTNSVQFCVIKGVPPKDVPVDDEDYQTLLNLVKSIVNQNEGKLDKINTGNELNKSFVYVSNANNEVSVVEATPLTVGGSVVQRDVDGKIRSATPNYEDDCDNVVNLEYFKNHAHDFLSYLINLNIPKTENPINSTKFAGLSQIKTLAVSGEITSIQKGAFNGCSSVEDITLPVISGYKLLDYFGVNSTADLPKSLKKLTVLGSGTIWNSFASNVPIETIVIGDDITQINEYAFFKSETTSRTTSSIKIGKSVQTIYKNAFQLNRSVKSYYMPKTLTYIGENAFQNNSSLEVMDFSEHESVPTLVNANAFTLTPSTLKIVVPDELYEQWIISTNWSDLASKIISKTNYTSGVQL